MYKPVRGDIKLWTIDGWTSNGVLLDSCCEIFTECGLVKSTSGVTVIEEATNNVDLLRNVYQERNYYMSAFKVRQDWEQRVKGNKSELVSGKVYTIYSIWGYRQVLVLHSYGNNKYSVLDEWGTVYLLQNNQNILGIAPTVSNLAVSDIFRSGYGVYETLSYVQFSEWRINIAKELIDAHKGASSYFEIIPLNMKAQAAIARYQEIHPKYLAV